MKTSTFQAAQVLVCRVETALTAQRQAKMLRKRHTRPEETMRHPGGEAKKKKKPPVIIYGRSVSTC